MIRGAVLAACMLIFFASNVRAEFYRWVDKDGKEFFTNDKEKIPQEYRAGSSTVKPDGNRVTVEDRTIAPGTATTKVKERKDKNGKGEEYWHKRAAKLRRSLNDLQSEYDVLVKHEREQEEKQNDLGSKKKIKAAENRSKKKMQLEKKITIAKRRLEVDLPEEARRADAYPGWLRE